MPAAIDLLDIDTLPDGLALSPEMAVVANAATNKNNANLQTIFIFDTGLPPPHYEFFGPLNRNVTVLRNAD
jgi:hypothetical protein